MKRIFWGAGFLLLIAVLSAVPAPAGAGDEGNTARQKAAEIHRIASSDVIYQEQAVQALYYQNLEIIGLLEDIRGLMKELVEAAKDDGQQ
jgi:hypothetical protein